MERSIKTAKRNLKGLQKTLKFNRRQLQSEDNMGTSIVASQSIEIDDLRAPQIFTVEGSSVNLEEQDSSSSNYQYYATICGNFRNELCTPSAHLFLIYIFFKLNIVNIIAIAHGAALGFTSPFMPLLMSAESPLTTGALTESQASWVVSIICIGGLIGTFIYGWMADTFGRKFSSIALAVPQMVPIFLIWNEIIIQHFKILKGILSQHSFRNNR